MGMEYRDAGLTGIGTLSSVKFSLLQYPAVVNVPGDVLFDDEH